MGEHIFDKYEIINRLAVGGMGEVFYAVQRGVVRGFERPVILKSLLPDLARQEGFIEQFLDEARVAATLNHPNVVSIYEVGLWNGVYFIAMEFIRGRNVSQLIRASLKAELPIPPAVIARVVRDAALGLDHAHTATDGQGRPLNIVHRDISPQNIMVRDDGVTKVVDFGIARAANRSNRTATGAVKGKLAYMAPEQVASRPVDALADQFALGVVLWEMCTRRRLFQAEHDVELITQVLQAEVPPPSAVAPGLPPELDELALKMLARDPGQRVGSSALVARELEAFLVRFSPPSSESPVAAYLKQLGVDDQVAQALKPPSSGQNFVISLKGEAPSRPGAGAPSATAVTTPSPPAARPRPVRALAGLFLLLALAGSGGAFWVMARRAAEPAPTVVTVRPPDPLPAEPIAATPKARAPGSLVIASVPPGATVRLNGRKAGETPQTLEVPAGALAHLQLDKPGYAMLEQDVTVGEGEERRVELRLQKVKGRAGAPPAAAPAPPPALGEGGFLSIDTTPWSRVAIDGEEIGSTPIFKRRLAPGRHTVLMTAGEVHVTRLVDVAPGSVTKLQVTLK